MLLFYLALVLLLCGLYFLCWLQHRETTNNPHAYLQDTLNVFDHPPPPHLSADSDDGPLPWPTLKIDFRFPRTQNQDKAE